LFALLGYKKRRHVGRTWRRKNLTRAGMGWGTCLGMPIVKANFSNRLPNSAQTAEPRNKQGYSLLLFLT
jgi:hypothetical protein